MQLHAGDREGIALRTGGTAFQRRATSRTRRSTSATARWYLQQPVPKYGNERLVLAAYNAGQGNVDRWRAEGQEIEFAETRAYVERVEHLKHVYREAWHAQLYA